jgi:putative ABC transport system permease protein
MNILTIPLKNMRRKLLRTNILITVFSVGIIAVVMLYYVSSTIGHSLEKKMTEFGANIVIYPKTDSLNISYGGFSLGNLSYQVKYLSESNTVESIKNIKNHENISTIAPKLIEMTRYNDKPLAVAGVVWEEELKIKSYWAIEGSKPEDENQVVIGQNVSKLFDIGIGTTINIGDGELYVTGILSKTGTEDDNLIFSDLHYLQGLTGKQDRINFAEVAALCAGCPIDEIVTQIQGKLPQTDINALQNIVKQRMTTITLVKNMVMMISVVILVIACFMLSMFMLASVNERKKEIGILRAVGYSGFKIFIIFGFEALIIGALSGLAGFMVGFAGSIKLLDVLKLSEITHIAFDPKVLLVTIGAVSVLSVIASSFPATKATRLKPVEVFSQI